MGCISSKKELNDINPNIYRVVNVDDDGVALWSGQLGITRLELTLYRKGKDPTRWPLKCLRRYGYDADLFTFEAGRRCTTGQGIYAFRCRRAESLFQTLQSYIQVPVGSIDDNSNSADLFPVPIISNGPSVTPRNRNSTNALNSNSGNAQAQQGSAASTGNYILSYRPSSQNLSPSGTIHSHSYQSRSTDTLNGESNYLEPIPNRAATSRFHSGLRLGSVSSGGPLSPDLHSPGSPNSITNILEVTTLNPLPVSHPGISNLYQELPPMREHNNNNQINSNNNNNNNSNINNNNNNNINNNSNSNNNISSSSVQKKKLSLDIPPQELAPSLSLSSLKTPKCASINATALLNNNEQQLNETKQNIMIPQSSTQPLQAINSIPNSESCDSAHMYMNIAPGELQASLQHQQKSAECNTPQIAQTPTTTISMFGGLSRLNSTFSSNPSRFYENLEPGEMRPLLTRSRYSKPDIFAKVDLPTDHKSSEPSTPSHNATNITYIVLDLDKSSQSNIVNSLSFTTSSVISSSNSITLSTAVNSLPSLTLTASNKNDTTVVTSNVACSSTSTISLTSSNTASPTSTATTVNTTGGGISSTSLMLLPPDSPKKGVLDYATIDFNKTVALSNSTTPSSDLDSEGSRKTRHSSVVLPVGSSKHSNSISD